ncbi:MAG TPA: histidine phosphatase family protein [Alphaproteobacteria bacterium]|nr:histidine phosphatase family protein [Alphaproteobacteria bacterium]
MTQLVLIRHAPTAWNREGRMQGHEDVPLLDESRADLARRRIPEPYAGFRALASPLRRCIDTAALLGLVISRDPRLIEMDWGDYQGHTLAELRAHHGFDLAANEARGLDFRPPRGESPRDVQTRVAPLLVEIASAERSTIAVTHRGVIRAVYARAVGWDMTGEAPQDFDVYALHVFRLERDGTPRVDRLNVPLAPR